MANPQLSQTDLPTILIVESDLALRDCYVESLSSNGFTVASAASGPAAIRLLPDLKPSAVVLDMDVHGGTSGAVVLAFIRSHPALRDTAVVAICRQSVPESRVHLMRADRCLPKPTSASNLLAALIGLLSASAS